MIEHDARDRERAQTVETGSIGQLSTDSRRLARDGDGGLNRARKASLAHESECTASRVRSTERPKRLASPTATAPTNLSAPDFSAAAARVSLSTNRA